MAIHKTVICILYLHRSLDQMADRSGYQLWLTIYPLLLNIKNPKHHI